MIAVCSTQAKQGNSLTRRLRASAAVLYLLVWARVSALRNELSAFRPGIKEAVLFCMCRTIYPDLSPQTLILKKKYLKKSMFSISTKGKHFCLPAVCLCEREDTVRSFNHGKVLSMACMHFMKFALENRIGQEQDIRQRSAS